MSNTDRDELFDLCKQVYEKTGWKMPKSSRNRFYNIKGSLVKNENDRDDAWTFPLYTSDYLLEKLPKQIDGKQLQGYFEDDCTTYGYGRDVTVMHWEGLSPIKALLLLTLALSEAGELKENKL